jgi:hypothetical protein
MPSFAPETSGLTWAVLAPGFFFSLDQVGSLVRSSPHWNASRDSSRSSVTGKRAFYDLSIHLGRGIEGAQFKADGPKDRIQRIMTTVSAFVDSVRCYLDMILEANLICETQLFLPSTN